MRAWLMDLLIHVSSVHSARILAGLAGACARAGRGFACFFTLDGVRMLDDPAVRAAVAGALRAVACGESWHRFCGTRPCPVELGSQTDNSALMGHAARTVSL
ncbi:MAG TPA: hypothetical protein DHV08_06060 [Rhodocyclaceae bacterium]|nr:MAG: hypothetical protein AUK49_05735 [Betaproteobacteria bacterium CG2_30_68_42]PIV72039.1 MAG: hypothetical protein COW56_11400 [Rhodocyclales bacterium CG17_big_fil_post_rev_8_21_14_2_50_68_7]PIX74372.1 MAG: hypothetical protein COZ38_10690 [Rhodocyclales bacterium CG_4_10_14_3_um_filter_68_10]PJA56493.1 MAG: hypothetical protein CO164_12815 [Rhodocyclales bacterium CG_4_9_14_3_um_filter_68_10]HCX33149.1 hypothetical protein [Rhodocyclaceae bacterium]